jgi:nucleoside-diphosphate-sugar epimerase
MPEGVFVTGGTGFVGRRLLRAIPALGRRVFVLTRHADTARRADDPGISIVAGDLLRPESYRNVLSSCDTVLHLAAVTGAASAAEHERVNAQGTEVLLEECRRAGVEKVLFVSSVAVSFPDKTGYHYALAKVRAEDAVRRSGLRFLIVRPTMILGPGAPILAALAKLATLPVAVLPGNGQARIQPIHVDDVVSCLVAAVQLDAFDSETSTMAGPETITIEDLIRRVRRAYRGSRGPLAHLPLPLLRIPLRLAETIGLGGLLPLTAGQLASFRFDGMGATNRLQQGTALGIDQMIARLEPAADSSSSIDAECAVFSRYLLGMAASEYVCLKYRAAHASLDALSPAHLFDAFLVRFARTGPRFATVADAYAAVFAPHSLLRKKLVVLLAILETSSPECELIDAPAGGGRPARAAVAIGFAGLGALVALAVAVPILSPIQLVLAMLPKATR